MRNLLVLATWLGFGLCLWPMTSMAYETCKISSQSGTGSGYWCSQHHQEGIIRCYADVEFESGQTHRFWGHQCFTSYSDCWSSGPGAVEPECAE